VYARRRPGGKTAIPDQALPAGDDTDRDWEHFGRTDPYWAVFTEDRFRKENLDQESLADFLASGVTFVDWLLATIRHHIDPQFSPGRALDFGCGVGRLILPLAQRCTSVVGVDVSESMLREARAHTAAQGTSNVSLLKGDDLLSAVQGVFDLVNSYIVFQHIPCRRGQALLKRLVDLVADGGVGVVHLTYAKAAFEPFPDPAPAPPPPPPAAAPPRWRAAWRRLIGAVRPAEVTPPPPPPVDPAPRMQMNPYDLNPLFHLLQVAGVRRMHVEFTDHGGELGVVLFFQRTPGAAYSA
jgi:SAM-dependent methyltransferase